MVLIAEIVVGIAKSVMAECGFVPDTLSVSLLFTLDFGEDYRAASENRVSVS